MNIRGNVMNRANQIGSSPTHVRGAFYVDPSSGPMTKDNRFILSALIDQTCFVRTQTIPSYSRG